MRQGYELQPEVISVYRHNRKGIVSCKWYKGGKSVAASLAPTYDYQFANRFSAI